MEGITDEEMNEFVKLNPEYAQDFYKQMRDKYKHTGYATESTGMVFLDMSKVDGIWAKDPLKFP